MSPKSFFPLFLQASFLSSGFSIFFSFLLFREGGKEETLSGIVSIRKGEKDGRQSSPRVSKVVVSVLHFRREMSGRRINRGNASSGYVTQTERNSTCFFTILFLLLNRPGSRDEDLCCREIQSWKDSV